MIIFRWLLILFWFKMLQCSFHNVLNPKHPVSNQYYCANDRIYTIIMKEKRDLVIRAPSLQPNLYAYIVTSAGDSGISLCIEISVHE